MATKGAVLRSGKRDSGIANDTHGDQGAVKCGGIDVWRLAALIALACGLSGVAP